jgi:predicted enzyme related to lactoylglutathione lyase
MTAADWPRPVVHWALQAKDSARQRAFYAALFNWVITDGPVLTIDQGPGAPIGGGSGHIEPGTTSRFVLYVQVRDIEESLRRTVELGGSALSEPFQFPGTPTLASIEDPEGNPIMLVQQ